MENYPLLTSVYKQDNSLVMEIAVPGLDEEFLDLQRGENRTLILKSKARNDNPNSLCGKDLLLVLGPIPEIVDIENMTAACLDGLLRICLPAISPSRKQPDSQYNPFNALPGLN